MKQLPQLLFIPGMISILGSSDSSSLQNAEPGGEPKRVRNQPNVIFFALDDLNDWVTPLGYNQVKTPNMDRLAREGVVFTYAHAPGVFSAPSRTAIMTGLNASTTGCYGEDPFRFDHPDLVTLQMAFKQGGYSTYGAGKIYHHRGGFVDLRGWDEYFSRSQEMRDLGWEMNSYYMSDTPRPTPFPYSPYYTKTGRAGDSALHLEWGPIPDEREDEMVDAIRTNWACDIIKQKHIKPFFLALGLYSPHYPNYAPQKYFDMYDSDSIRLPPYNPDDLDDLPESIRRNMLNRSKQHRELEELNALEDAVTGYLAATSFADAMLGRVLDALDASPYKDNTIIVLWSDQGFHHGEKMHWGKHTLWQRTSHIPFIWAGKGIPANMKVETSVSLIDMYPTFIELCHLPDVAGLEGESLVAALKNPSGSKDRNVFLPGNERGSYAVINTNWRYIHYSDGAEELYNVTEDPNEWNNLAVDENFQSVVKKMKKSAPAEFAPVVTPKNELKLVVEGDSFHWEKKTRQQF
ncbi:MAG: sulfatase [Bacteroidales bacterium]|jgi:arylsulfatase A-like enzyme|nr:sulfatase [Bacteroidales bacterium]